MLNLFRCKGTKKIQNNVGFPKFICNVSIAYLSLLYEAEHQLKVGRDGILEVERTESLKKRILLNASKAYVAQSEVGEEYRQLQPVYALNFVNAPMNLGVDGYYHHYQLVHHSFGSPQSTLVPPFSKTRTQFFKKAFAFATAEACQQNRFSTFPLFHF